MGKVGSRPKAALEGHAKFLRAMDLAPARPAPGAASAGVPAPCPCLRATHRQTSRLTWTSLPVIERRQTVRPSKPCLRRRANRPGRQATAARVALPQSRQRLFGRLLTPRHSFRLPGPSFLSQQIASAGKGLSFPRLGGRGKLGGSSRELAQASLSGQTLPHEGKILRGFFPLGARGALARRFRTAGRDPRRLG